MARKNIFQLVDENYDIQKEIKKISALFCERAYFAIDMNNFTFKRLISQYLFIRWKYRGTCINLDEYFQRANAIIPSKGNATEEQIINYLEVMENFIKLYDDNYSELLHKYGLEYYEDFDLVFINLIDILEKRMGLNMREYKDRVVIYPKNAPLEKVIDINEDEDVQWELIRYAREDLSLSEKRKSLAYLATNLYIEEDPAEKDEQIKITIEKAKNVLNNLHIRHNNKTGKWKNEVIKDIDEKDAITLCDMVFNEMLTIVLMREHKEYETTYKNFNNKQKQASKKKKLDK